MLGKVYKYEFMALARKLIFVVIVTVVISLGMGGVLRSGLERGTESFDLDCRSASGFETVYVFIVSLIFFTITLSTIEKRFDKSLLGDEAYLNLSLPVTFGEHMWGRWLAGMSWMILMAAGVALSTFTFVLPLWKYVSEIPTTVTADFNINGNAMNAFEGITQIVIYLFFFVSLMISFVFMVKAVCSNTGHKRIVSTVLIIVSILLYLFIKSRLVYSNSLIDDNPWLICLISNLVSVIITGANLGITYYFVGKKLDLE